MRRTAVLAVVVAAALMAVGAAGARAETMIFAAASTTNALKDVIAAYEAATGRDVTASFASSSTLAKQITQGAPADIFISANPRWMDVLDEDGLLVPGSRSDLLGNRLVLIAPAEGATPVTVDAALPLAAMLGPDGRLSVGDPDHVPAGIYARQALTHLGLWDAVEPRLAPASDVRAALALVARNETPYGIVYATDAAVSPDTAIVGTFPAGSHPAITYPVALLQDAGPEATAVLDFLKSDAAAAISRRHGFGRSD